MRMIKVFIDSSGWYALIQSKEPHYELAKDYFQQLLDSRANLYSNIVEVTVAISKIKKHIGLSVATDFSRLIDQSVMSNNLHVSWASRRLHRAALKQFFSIKDPDIEIIKVRLTKDGTPFWTMTSEQLAMEMEKD